MSLHYVELDGNVVVGIHEVRNSEGFVLPAGAKTITAAQFAEIKPGATRTGNVFQAPVVVAAPVKQVSKLDFFRLFTQAERIAIRAAAAIDPVLQDWFELLQAADTVNLDHPDVVAGLAALQTAKLITADRTTAVVANSAPVTVGNEVSVQVDIIPE